MRVAVAAAAAAATRRTSGADTDLVAARAHASSAQWELLLTVTFVKQCFRAAVLALPPRGGRSQGPRGAPLSVYE